MSELSDRITKEIAWYEANRGVLASAMPLSYQGTTWRSLSLVDMDRQIASYRSGELSPHLARVYVLNQLRHLYRAFQQHQKEIGSGK